MPKDVYERLARHLDRLPGGYPRTESGVEIRILKRLFTPEEAELALCLTVIPEEARVIARRAKLPLEETERRLESMVQRGLVFSMARPGKPTLYMAAQFVIGIWEYHVNDLDPELVRDVNEYLPHVFDPELWKKSPQLRTVPVGKAVEVEHAVLAHERAEELVCRQKKILVAPCICRREHEIAGKGCGKLEEACLIFGAAADYYERRGVGRVIGADEALEILARAEEEGLVLQPSNSQKAVNICCCCGCCCQVLKNIARHPRPAEIVSSAFVARLDVEACVGCGKCVKRCQTGAFTLKDKKGRLAAERCIGCGLCVTRCPTGALTLERKPESPEVPRTYQETLLKLGRARGALTPTRLALTALRSKLDRLLATRG
ncbi:4Fe-4S binding protein [Deferrisoma palaeochoriense]